MIQRYWRFWLAGLVILAVALAAWLWNRPAPQATLENLKLDNGVALVMAKPPSAPKTYVALGVTTEDALSEKQLLALSRDASAQIVQVALPKDDCALQDQTLKQAAGKLDKPATVVAGIGPGAILAWRWLAQQTDDKAIAISVGMNLEDPGCHDNLPQSAPHGHWLADWNDWPDDTAAKLARDQPNAQTSITDYDIKLPQVLNNELRHQLVGGSDDDGGLHIPVVEVPVQKPTDTVTLFLSGDGGWRDLDKDVAGEMAKVGYPTVGIDTLRYYWEHKAPEQTATDLADLMAHYRQKWGTKRFILMGYSFGADVLPAIYNRLDPDDQNRVDAIVLLAFARSGSFEIAVEGWLGAAGKEAATGPEMARLPAAKVLCVYGLEEKDESGCTEATAPGEKLALPGGHHFDENYPALAKRLIEAINKRQNKTATQ